MHERLSELLGHEVVGEVTRVGDTRAHLDVGLGRVCLDRLDGAEVEELLGRLRKSPLGAGAKVRDRLRLEQPKHLVRGLVEVQVADETLGSTYVLQLTTAPLLALYERRFVLEPGVHGDLAGVICRGLATVFEGGREAPLRQISGYDDLQRRYLEQLDAAV